MSTTTRDIAPHGLGYYVAKLLRLRWAITWSNLRRARLGRKIGYIILGLVILGALAGLLALSWLLLGMLRSPEAAVYTDAARLVTALPVALLGTVFFIMLVTSFGVLLQALYLAGDMDFLLSAPLPMRAVFISKLLQAILPNFGLVSLFALPVLYGLGLSSHLNLLYFPLALLVLAALALAAAGLAALLVLWVVRLVPARRVAEVLALVGGVLSLLCSQSGQFARFSHLSQAQTAQTLQVLARLDTPWSPLAWAGRGLVALGEGRWLTGVGLLILTFGLGGAILWLALLSAERLYYSGWARMQVGGRKKRATRRPQASVSTSVARGRIHLLPAMVRGLITKDLLVLRRDLRNMSQLLTPLLLGALYAFMFLRAGDQPPAGRGEAPTWFMRALQSLWIYGHVAIALFVSWSLLSRLALMGFSQEGRYYWLLKVAPVSTGRLLLSKFLVAYFPALLLGWVYALLVALLKGSSPGALLYELVMLALCIAGACGLNLAFGVAGANMAWEDPRHMVRGMTGCLGALVTVVYMFIILALFFVPVLVALALNWPQILGQAIGLLLGGGVSLLCAWLPPRLVRERVSRLGEE